ncbi:hypothetical protein D3C87_1312830 [compost metagenome]
MRRRCWSGRKPRPRRGCRRLAPACCPDRTTHRCSCTTLADPTTLRGIPAPATAHRSDADAPRHRSTPASRCSNACRSIASPVRACRRSTDGYRESWRHSPARPRADTCHSRPGCARRLRPPPDHAGGRRHRMRRTGWRRRRSGFSEWAIWPPTPTRPDPSSGRPNRCC